jgi:hypothetical protein
MKSGSSLLCSQKPFICPYPKPDESSPYHPSYLKTILISSSHLHLGLYSGLFISGFPTHKAYLFAKISATSPSVRRLYRETDASKYATNFCSTVKKTLTSLEAYYFLTKPTIPLMGKSMVRTLATGLERIHSGSLQIKSKELNDAVSGILVWLGPSL